MTTKELIQWVIDAQIKQFEVGGISRMTNMALKLTMPYTLVPKGEYYLAMYLFEANHNLLKQWLKKI